MYRIVLNETSYYGAGCRSVIAEEVRKRGFRKALLVTDKDLIRFGVAEKIERVLADAGIPYEIYSEIKANPTIRNVQQGVEAFKRSGADFMVALGGGSSIDTAKAVGIIVNNPEFADVRSLEGTAATKHRAVPTFAVPTTAGTAAEVTINYVITDEEAKRKMVCVDPNDIPMCAVIDCELMYSMPKGLTAATGMDALTHAVEGYLTPGGVDDERHVRIEGDRADRPIPEKRRRRRQRRDGPCGHGRGAVYRRHGLFECGAGHRPLDGSPAGSLLRHAARRGQRYVAALRHGVQRRVAVACKNTSISPAPWA